MVIGKGCTWISEVARSRPHDEDHAMDQGGGTSHGRIMMMMAGAHPCYYQERELIFLNDD